MTNNNASSAQAKVTIEPGQNIVATMKSGQNLVLASDAAVQAMTVNSKGELIIKFADGASLTIKNFSEMAKSGDASLTLPNGQSVNLGQLAEALGKTGPIGATDLEYNAPDANPKSAGGDIHIIKKPGKGEDIIVKLEAGDEYKFSFNMTEPASVKNNGGQLVISFKNGGEIIIPNYGAMKDSATLPEFTMQDGTKLSVSDFSEVLATAAQLNAVEPAAGEAGGGGAGGRGGFGFGSVFSSGELPNLGKIGPIDPTQLQYNTFDRQPLPEIQDDIPVITAPPVQAVDETDLTPGPETVSGTVTANFGNDGPGTFSAGATGTTPQFGSSVALTSEGNPVTVTLVGNTYTGTAGGATIFTLTINSDGTYTFTLTGTLDHPDTTNPDDIIRLDFAVTATDADGDAVSTTIGINVHDDGPIANDDTNNFDQVAGGPNTTTGNVVTGFNGGPGAADDLSEDGASTVTQVQFGGTTVAVPAVGYVSISGTYGTLTINAQGEYSYTLYPTSKGDTADSFTYSLTDYDGDTDTAVLRINSDGIPEIYDPNDPAVSPGDRVVDESNLGPTSVSGDLNANFYTDTPGTITLNTTFSSSTALTSEGNPVTVSLSGNTYTGTANGATIFTLTVDPATGNYTFTLVGTLDHPDTTNPDDAIALNFGVTATDSDGDTASSTLTINVKDDGPVANDDANFIDQATATTASGNVITGAGNNPAGGADSLSEDDGNSVTGVSFNGGAVVSVPAGGSVVINGAYGQLTLNSDGTYSYTLFPTTKGDTVDQFTYTLTDGDGDSDNAVLSIGSDGKPEIYDPNDPRVSPGTRTVDESDLGPTSVSGDLNANFFTDTPGTISFNGPGSFFSADAPGGLGALTSEGYPVTVTLTGNTYTGSANGSTIFTITIDPSNGNYTFTLTGTLDHPNAADPNDVINLHFGVTATDSDGDTDSSVLTIRVLDDGPVANDDHNSFDAEDLSTNGNVVTGFHGGPGAADQLSEDGATTVTQVQFGATIVAVPASGTVSIVGTYGTLTINSAGEYTYVLKPGVKGDTHDNFTYTIKDGDGDTDTAILSLDADGVPVIFDPNDPNLSPGARLVDETNLGPTSVSGDLNANFFSDTPGTITPTGAATFSYGGSFAGAGLTSEGHPVTVSLAGNTYTGTANGQPVFTLTINPANGNYTFTLLGTLDHANPADPNDVINLNFGVTATDSDGDTDSATLTIRVLDDGPIANDDHNAYNTADGGTSGNVITGVNGGPGAADDLSNDDITPATASTDNHVTKVQFGSTVVDVPAGGSATIHGDNGTLTIHSDGSYTYVLDAGAGGGGGGGTTVDIPRTFAGNTFPTSLPESVPVTDPNLLGEIHSNMTVAPDTTITGQITFEGAGYTNSLGLFTIAADGTLQAADMVQAQINGPGANFTVDPSSSATQLGFFIIADGWTTNGGYAGLDFATGSLQFVTNYGGVGERPANINDAGAGVTLVFTDAGGVEHVIQGPIYFTTDRGGSNSLNPDGLVHTISGVDASDPHTLTIGFEDLPGGGDYDYNDLVFNVQITDHVTTPGGGDVADQFIYTLTDGDGDSDTAILYLNGDGQPVIADPAARELDETQLNGGPIALTGHFNADFFTDTPGTITPTGVASFNSSVPLTSEGSPVVVTLVGATYVGTSHGQTIFTLLVEADGDYTFTQFGTLDHPNAADPDDVIGLTFGITATDSDGDTDTTTLTVNVRDDGPIANDDTQTLDNVTTVGGNVITGTNGGPGAADKQSQDDVNTVSKVTYNGTDYTVPAGGSATIAAANGTLTINSNGTYTYTLKPGVKGDTNDAFTYTLKDGDGDTDTAVLTLKADGSPDIFDPNDPNLSPGTRTVDETNLSPNTTVSGDLNANFFSDTPGTFGATTASSFSANGFAGGSLTSEGHPVTVTLAGNVYTGTANGQTIFTLTINPSNGNYVFDLKGTLDHGNASNPDDVINLNFGVKATDSDGDVDTDTLTIRVKDDGPVANDDIQVLDNVTTTTGNVITGVNGGAGAADQLSQDDVNTVTKVVFNGTTYNVAATGNTVVTTANGTLTINAQGQYSYALKSGVKGDTADVFTYTLKDGDGDTDTALLTIKTDGGPDIFDPNDPNLSPGARVVDETNLNPNTTVSGDLNANFYTDTPGTFGATAASSFTASGFAGSGLTSEGQPVTVTLSGNTYTGTSHGQTIFTLTINPSNGNYTFDLKGTLDHADKTNPDDIINLNFGVKATDSDGDVSSSTLTIRVKDDGPVAHDDVNDLAITQVLQPVAKDYNVVLVLDVSGSMSGTKLDLLKGAVNNLLTTFNGYTGGEVKVHFVTFSSTTQSETTFSVTNLTEFNAAKAWINGLSANGNTNYEDPLQSAVTWLQSTTGNKPIPGADTYTYFISDGEPNTYVSGSNHNVSGSAATVMNEIQGIGETAATDTDGTLNEVAALKALSDEVIGVGIGVSATTIARLDIIDSNGDALDVQNPADLSAALQGSNPVVTTVVSVATGNVISGLNGGPGAADQLSQDDVNTVTKVTFKGADYTVPAGGSTTVTGDWGTLKIYANGDYTYTPKPGVDFSNGFSEQFKYTLTDGDGDPSQAWLTLRADAPLLKVGENVDDKGGSTTPYEVGTGTGVITGAGAQDILVGDVGGSSLQNVNKDYNVVLVLDVSGSMEGSKLALLKSAVNNLLTSFNGYTGGAVKVHFVTFSDSTKAETTFTVTNATDFNSAKTWINALSANGTTNYEDPLQDAITWLQSTTGNAPIAGAETYTYFVSDGEPNRYMNNSNTAVDGSADVVMQNITGTYNPSGTSNDDTVSEVAILKSLSTDVIGVGIGVSAATLARLDVIDKDGDALDVQNPADLSAALAGASPLNKLAAAGSDVITGGAAGDLIFGDSVFTDALAVTKGLATTKGAGWDVFAQLEAGGTGWTRADTINYIKTHTAEVGQESVDSTGAGRQGGHDTLNGGAGDDIIYGQEGNDLITGGAGNDSLIGGTGADTFVFHPGDGVDHIKDFNAAAGDKLDLSDILSSYDPMTDILQNFVHTVSSGADTLVQVDPTGTGAAFTTIAVLEGVHVDINALAAGGNLIA